jgi:predicted ATPase
MGFGGAIATLTLEWEDAQRRGEALCSLANEHSFPFYQACGLMFRAYGTLYRGDLENGAALAKEGLSIYREAGAKWELPHWLGILVSLLSQRPDEAAAYLAEAFGVMEETEERFHGADLYRERGELLLATRGCDASRAEADFRTALAIATRQGARLFELRAATSLARLLSAQDRRGDAYELLVPIYNRFSEGLNTRLLRESKQLVDRLQH